jgi:HEAT repeat protein
LGHAHEWASCLPRNKLPETEEVTVSAVALSMPDDGQSLLEAVRHEDPEIVAWAATRLGMRGDDRSVDALCGLLGHVEGAVRSAAATALGLIGSERAMVRLREAVRDVDADVAQAAALALARMGDADATADACTRLKTHLRGGDAEERAHAARALGALGMCDSYDELSLALGDPDPGVRGDAAAALGQLSDARATAALAAAGFTDSDKTVRESAMRALARLVTAGAAARPQAG